MVDSFQCSFVQDLYVVLEYSQDVVQQFFGLSKKVVLSFTESTLNSRLCACRIVSEESG